MVCWLLLPTARCAWHAFRDTPISEGDPAAVNLSDADKERLRRGEGFFDELGTATKRCYAATPMFEQEAWKVDLFYALAGLAVIAFAAARYEAWRKRSYVKS